MLFGFIVSGVVYKCQAWRAFPSFRTVEVSAWLMRRQWLGCSGKAARRRCDPAPTRALPSSGLLRTERCCQTDSFILSRTRFLTSEKTQKLIRFGRSDHLTSSCCFVCGFKVKMPSVSGGCILKSVFLLARMRNAAGACSGSLPRSTRTSIEWPWLELASTDICSASTWSPSTWGWSHPSSKKYIFVLYFWKSAFPLGEKKSLVNNITKV